MKDFSEQIQTLRHVAYAYSKNGLGAILNEAADTIETLSAKLVANSGWIPCSERLSDNKGWYLVYAKNQRPFVAYFKGKTFPLNNHYHEIVAWQPLPEPYHE